MTKNDQVRVILDDMHQSILMIFFNSLVALTSILPHYFVTVMQHEFMEKILENINVPFLPYQV